MKRYLILFALCFPLAAASGYRIEKMNDHGVEIIRLEDIVHGVEVSIIPSIGNRIYEFKIHGKNLLYFPFSSVGAFKDSGGRGFNGVPVLLPWANRIAGGGFWANGKHYLFNPNLGTVHLDRDNIAIHGMLTATSLWEITELKADKNAAWLTSRLPFWKYPDLIANWPFAQDYELTYRLSNGVLEVKTTVQNLSKQPMPVMVGFHPYFNIPDVPRSECSVHLPVRKHVETDQHLVATGEMTPVQFEDQVSLKDRTFDDGFTGIERGPDGKATFSVQSGNKKIEVIYGKQYQVAIVYAPPKQNYICFEPMAAITNGANAAHEGKYPDLETLAGGATWQESFWIRGSGF